MRRDQMAAFLTRALGLTDGRHQGFTDVPRGSTFDRDVRRLAAAGVTLGCNPPANDRFCPDDVVTREQMAAFLQRAYRLPSHSTRFRDVGASSYALAIGALARAEITLGCNPPTNDRFCPSGPVTRAQMATFLRRAEPR